MRRLLYLLPLLGCLSLGVFFFLGLDGNPREVPSAFINKPAPEFSLSPLPGRQVSAHADLGILSRKDLVRGQTVIINVWASWCVPCVAEHPLVDQLSKKHGVLVHGINYRDKASAAANWLARLGDPYGKVGFDSDGRVGIEWGVYGVPETFVVNGNGMVLFKHAGALTPEILEQDILPLIRKDG
jgi:cytochrome c biogenesis protein CcmG/thiol:disulfide interchange protein DsbE